VDEMGRACSTRGEKSNVCRILLEKPEGKRSLRNPRKSWEDNININLVEVGCGGMDCIDLSQDRDQWRPLVNIVLNLRVL
jgi:hypothetical protein